MTGFVRLCRGIVFRGHGMLCVALHPGAVACGLPSKYAHGQSVQVIYAYVVHFDFVHIDGNGLHNIHS